MILKIGLLNVKSLVMKGLLRLEERYSQKLKISVKKNNKKYKSQ